MVNRERRIWQWRESGNCDKPGMSNRNDARYMYFKIVLSNTMR